MYREQEGSVLSLLCIPLGSIVSDSKRTVPYLGFGTQSGQYGKPGGLSTVDYKSADELDIDENGHFELIISVKPPKNRLSIHMTHTNTHTHTQRERVGLLNVIYRITFRDWSMGKQRNRSVNKE